MNSEMFQTLLLSTPDLVYFKDKESRYTWINFAQAKILGLQDPQEALGKTDFDFFSHELAEVFFADEQEIMHTGQSHRERLETHKVPSGGFRWIRSTKIPLYDNSGNVMGTAGISRNVTEYKLAEQALLQESRKLLILMDNIPDPIYFKDTQGRFTWVNKAMGTLLNKGQKEELLGLTDFDVWPADRAQNSFEDEQVILSTGKYLINKEEKIEVSGKVFWLSATKIPLRDQDGNIIGTCGISRDMTTRIHAQEAYARESMLLDALMRNIPDAIYFKDEQSRFLKVSKAVHLEGIKTPEEAVGKTDFDFFTKEHAQQAFDDEQEIIHQGKSIIDKVEKETYKDKSDCWVSTTKVPVYNLEGNITGIVGISRDVTERMLAQHALQKAKDELEVRVQERTAALVQEIKEHLKTEKALRENEKKLQTANTNLQSRIQQLNYLNTSAQSLAHHSHRKDLLPAILGVFTQCFPGLEVSICEEEAGAYICSAATQKLNGIGNRESNATALRLLKKGPILSVLLIPDRQEDLQLRSLHWPNMEEHTVFLALPLLLEDRCLAIVEIFAKPDFLNWYQQEQVMIHTLAAQAAISLSNANNYSELEKRARLEGELEVAQKIQRRFTPQSKPLIPRVNVKGVYFPAYEVGGDYLDYFQTDAGHWVIVIADVSGKGIPAALVMTMLRSTFRAEARYENSAMKLLCAVNDSMIQDLDDKSFVTALCLIIDKEGQSMTYARAGHPPLLFRLANEGEQPSSMNPKGIALGMVEGTQFRTLLEEVTIPLKAGDRYLIYTDGLLEAMDPERKTYGLSRLKSMLALDDDNDPEIMLKLILDDVKMFTRNAPVHDDLTILAMDVVG